VAISPLRCSPDDVEALLTPNCTDCACQKDVWVPVAALPLLAVGDLWQDGRLVVSPDYDVESFSSLRIESDTTDFVKAGLAIDEKFLIPLGIHPWHRPHTQAYCVLVECGNGCRLLIPCVEIIRFYFGSSGNLIQRLFSVPLAKETLWSSKSFHPSDQHMHLVLAAGLSGVSASDVARIAGSQPAWRSAAGIHASCQKAAASGMPAYPYTGFPFEGDTDLVASGMWLPFGEERAATFLAYRLRSCSHAFPFRSLSYEMPKRSNRGKQSRIGNPNQAPAFRVAQRSAHAQTVHDDPSVRKSQRSRGFAEKNRFPDLLRKPVWKEKIEGFENFDVYLLRRDGSIEQVAFGEPGGSSEAAGIDATLQTKSGVQSSKQPSLPHFVCKALAQVRRDVAAAGNHDATVQVVCPESKSSPVFFLPIVVDENGEITPELLFSEELGQVRQRRGCFVEVVGRGKAPDLLAIVEGRVAISFATVVTVAELDVHSLIRYLFTLGGSHTSLLVPTDPPPMR
ncbi:MAG: hypothetical protein FWD64_08775, partial [Acidobacteriaceae bacterium]|nr:hypothetical protein [Acidobacteriaceae bacterium]